MFTCLGSGLGRLRRGWSSAVEAGNAAGSAVVSITLVFSACATVPSVTHRRTDNLIGPSHLAFGLLGRRGSAAGSGTTSMTRAWSPGARAALKRALH